jgi:hypothetical protein
MDEKINRALVQGDSLHLTRNSSVWSVTDNGKEPNEWKIVHYAAVGTSEEFIDFFSGELLELVDASAIYGSDRDKLKNSILTTLTEGLMPAFEQLKKVRLSLASPVPEINRKQHYEDFARVLWHAYKDLMPKTVSLLGFDIGFQFQKTGPFERGIDDFAKKHQNLIVDVPELLRRQREGWQQDLAKFRNEFLEHRSLDVGEVEKYYRPQWAEMAFDFAWRTIAELIPVFLEARFAPTYSIRLIPLSERDVKRPRRFQFFFCEPTDRSTM